MESEIWRVRTERIGTLESFRSEYDMESFLMNNPAIIGCWDPDAGLTFPTLFVSNCIQERALEGVDVLISPGLLYVTITMNYEYLN